MPSLFISLLLTSMIDFNWLLLTRSIFSSGQVRNAQNWQAMLDRVDASSTGGPASTQSSNEDINHQPQRSTSTYADQGLLPLASNRIMAPDQHPPCLFHGSILQISSAHQSQGYGLGPMSRFLAEGPSEQYAVFIRADTGALSTSRGCTCRDVLNGVSC